MYEIDRTEYGLQLTISGHLDPEEADEFVNQIRSQTQQLNDGFSVVADLRGMETFPPEVAEKIAELMEFCKEQGMGRSADVVESATSTLQMEQLVDQAGINERVIDATAVDDWETQAIEWVKHGNEPET